MIINIKKLKQNFDIDMIDNLLDLALETIEDNIQLIDKGLDEKNIENMHRGVHTLKSLGFLGMNNILNLSSKLAYMTANKKYDEINIKSFNKNYIRLKHECELFKEWLKKYKN